MCSPVHGNTQNHRLAQGFAGNGAGARDDIKRALARIDHALALVASGAVRVVNAFWLLAKKAAVPAALHGSESFASPGVDQVRWPNPVRPGDTLRLRCTVQDVRRSRSQPQLGILSWRWQLFNQHGAEVLSIDATSLFDTVRNAHPPV